MAQKEGIFLSIAQNDIHAVIHVLTNALDSKEKLALKDMYELFNQVESSLYWDHVKHHTLHSIESYCSSQSYADVHNAGNTEESHNQFMTVKAIANGIFDFCQVSKFKPSSLLDILLAMQNLLLVNDNDNSSELKPIKMLISKISEYFWVHEEEGAEYLMPNLLTHLLMISLDVHGRDTDIKRVYSLRGAFLLLDFEDPSIDFLVSLIHRCFTHPGYLKGLEGRKLLAFLLQSNGGLLVDSVSRIIRPQLLTGVDAVASSYGEIMYLSWKESSLFDSNKGVHKGSSCSSRSSCNSLVGSPNQLTQNLRVRTALEDLMQTLLRECVHASEMKYFRGLRSMIKSFHDTTRTDELNGMLLRVYDPIIWRSLRSANAKVRAQAAIMFLDVFPLQHDDVRAEDDDKILQKQFDLLSALLKDPDHQVRTNAVLGVCNILKEYWEVLPINTTHTILKFLVDTLAFDSSSANVRYSLFIGIGILLQQPLTHDLMKHLLPMLKLSIHDKSEKVRIAFVKILCQVKSIRGMHFYEIVSVDHLLERLAEDHHRPHVCHVMTQLLLNSFYPQEQSHDNTLLSQQHQQLEYQQISRCVQFIEMNPIAAEAFYSTLYEHISVGCIAKLITMLFSFLLASEQSPDKIHTMKISSQVNTKDKKRLRAGLVIDDKNKSSNDNSNSSTTVGEVDSVMDDLDANKRLPYPVRLGLMRVINCLLESVSNQFEIQEPARNLVCRYLTIDKTKWLLRQCAIPLPQDEVKEDSAAAAAAQHLIPIAFKLVASAKMLARMDVNHAAVGDNYQESVSNDFNTLVMTIFVPTWKAINGDVSATNTSALRSVLATSVINIARSSTDEVVLLGLIDQSLDSIDATIAPAKIVTCTKAMSSTSRSKASKKNKKSLTDNIGIDIISVIPFEAAIDLLVAYDISDRNVHVVCCDEQQQSILNSIFIKVRHHCEASIDGDQALAAVNGSLCKAIKVWVSRSIRSDALLLLDGVHRTSDAFSELMNVIQWCDDKVIKNVVSLSMDDSPIVATSIAFNVFMIALAELSDIIYLQLADHTVYRTIANWMEETMLSIRYPTEASVSSFQPIVARLTSLICTPATATSTASSNIEGEDEIKTLTQMHRLRNVMLKYLLTTITIVKGTNNQKLIMALLAANPTKYDDMLRTAVIHVLHSIIRSPDDDFQSTAHVATVSILNLLTSMKLVKQTHKVIVDMKSALHTTITTNTSSSSILTNSEYDAVCKLLTIVEQLSMDRNNSTQATALDKDRCIVKSTLKSAIVPSLVAIDPEQWTTI